MLRLSGSLISIALRTHLHRCDNFLGLLKMGRASVEFLLFVVILLASAAKGNRGPPCGSYGCPHRPQYEPFVPAPPGHTPRCAKPGQTFCESLEHYPQQLIQFLVDKCSYDFATVLRDESHYDFNSHRLKPEYHDGYDYPRQEVPQFYSQASPPLTSPLPQYPLTGQPSIVYGPPFNDTDHEGYDYSPPPRSQRNAFTIKAPTQLVLTSQPNFQGTTNPILYANRPINPFSQEQRWTTKRYLKRTGQATSPPRSLRNNPFLEFASSEIVRTKRQGNPDAISLCRTNSQYITPKAALNNQGNWMYVVNLPETREKYSQLVRSETCTTTECNGLCSLPEGYTSRCEQQYVQKRLIALEGTGDRLYTDVFWFPHGCTCKISLNF